MKRFALLLLLVGPVFAAGPHEFSISGLRCQGVICETREGIIPHQLTTVELSGSARNLAGSSVLLRVTNRQDHSAPIERKIGVMSDGRFSSGIPAYSLPDGQYDLTITAIGQPGRPLATGEFTVASVGAPSRNTPSRNTPGAGLPGHWLGIAGTVADLQIRPDGTYISGGTARGTWRQEGRDVIFTGPLTAWNGGRGTLNAKQDVIEFYWTNPQGARQYFVIGKY